MPDLYAQLVEIGIPADKIGPTMKLIYSLLEPLQQARAKTRARVAKCRGNVTRNATVTLQTPPEKSNEINGRVTLPVTLLARVEDNLLPLEIAGHKKEGRKITPRDELLTVLSPEMADAVIEHRQRMRCALTARAAKGLAKQLAKVADPNFAAETMLARGWRGFEPQWMNDNRPRNETYIDVANRMLREMNDGSESNRRNHHDVELLPAGSGGQGGLDEDLRLGPPRDIFRPHH